MDQTLEKPYAPSWVNRVVERIGNSKIPVWLTYIGLYLLCFGYLAVIFLLQSWDHFINNFVYLLANAIWIPIPLATIHYLVYFADKTTLAFRSEMDCEDEEFSLLQFRIKTIPQSVAITILVIVAIPIYYSTLQGPTQLFGEFTTPTTHLLGPIFPIVGFSFIPLLFYLTIRQLAYVNHMYRLVKKINIFHLQPLYILSGLTARTGVVWIIFLNLNILISGILYPDRISSSLFIIIAITEIVVSITAFLVPLWGIHNRISDSKEVLIKENSELMEHAYRNFETLMKKNDFDSLSKFEKGISSLFKFRTEIDNVSTWPWQTHTLRAFLSAVFLPLFIWITQQILERFF